MKTKDLEPGTHYAGPGGQIRELVTMDRPVVTYRQESRGPAARMGHGNIPKVGEVREMALSAFAFWALGEAAS